MQTDRQKIKDRIISVLKGYGIRRAALFGSFARGEAADNSDIDILVEITQDINLFEFIAIKQQLEEVLGRRVDLVEYDTIKPLLRDKIIKEQVVIYG